jgi:D-alanyl-D-alanine carboxypeptidase (penicillin-binding protein 5/6)
MRMKNTLMKIICMLLCTALFVPSVNSADEAALPFEVDAKSAVLMDAATGQILYEKEGVTALPPASVTKIMTLLLVMEAIDSGALSMNDTVSVSEYAASMGGSQVYLEPGEEMSMEDMLKSVVISSANDAAMALAEKISGSEESFVAAMNEKARTLGMISTNFENPTGLDDDTQNHFTSAIDIALMSRELITKHPDILNYSSIWMDTIRDGEFGLTNTNRLIRFYSGATGLKTGSTSKAGFCISATASRDGLHLIAVIMGSSTRDVRNEAAKKLLDYGFANYSIYNDVGGDAGTIVVLGGTSGECKIKYSSFSCLLAKGKNNSVEKEISLPETLTAPVNEGDTVGKIIYTVDGETVGECDIVAAESVEKISFGGVLIRILKKYLTV